jgi:ABC-2 type transport system ATP-binding protein
MASTPQSSQSSASHLNGSSAIDPQAAIVTQGLMRTFGPKIAVNSLNLTVRRGEFFGFLGPNGAGKSTTIKMMVGLLRPSAGHVWVGGVDVWREPLAARRLMGVLPEQLNLYDRLSGREFLTFAGHMYGLPKSEVTRRSEELLSVLTLASDADKLIVDYSVGMRKKIALAAALIHRPQVLFLDEPFEGIDPISSRIIRNILRELVSTGVTIFFSSHIMEVVERLCSRVGIINQGRLVAEGTLQELRERGAQGGNAQEAATLEDIFLEVVGARQEGGNLSWLE